MSVSLRREDTVAILTIDNPPVNAASYEVREALVRQLAQANADPEVGAIVLACAGKTFVAGADIKEFGTPPRSPLLGEVATVIESSLKPVVAAIHGTALGGGLEIALAAHCRIATVDAAVGLPEVKLGLVPGAGGTQRLPRLTGIPVAIDLVSSGRRVPAREALDLGIVDAIEHGDLLSAAVTKARELAGTDPRRSGLLPVPNSDSVEVERLVSAVERKARGQLSPGIAARLVMQAAEADLDVGLATERDCFRELVGSGQSRALRHVFAAERLASKIPGIEGASPRRIEVVAIIGAGLMGSGIATSFLEAGYVVKVIERDESAAAEGRSRINALHQRLLKSGRVDEAGLRERLDRLSVVSSRSGLADCDLIIEAVFDDFEVKKELFADLSKRARPDAILATNTSYLDPNKLAAVVDLPERFLGLHFFSPANIMRLVEVVWTDGVAPDVLATGLAVTKRLGKIGVVSNVCEGFIGNRLFTAYRRECDYMLEEGALPHEIDLALENFGFAMGPYAVNDMTGLDISWARRKRNAATRDPSERYVVIADRLCEMGRFGQKSGNGYYSYESGTRKVDDRVTALIEEASEEAGVRRRTIDAEEIVGRVSDALAAEGRALVSEGIVLRASDIDLVFINGYGYPAWRGGPMFYSEKG